MEKPSDGFKKLIDELKGRESHERLDLGGLLAELRIAKEKDKQYREQVRLVPITPEVCAALIKKYDQEKLFTQMLKIPLPKVTTLHPRDETALELVPASVRGQVEERALAGKLAPHFFAKVLFEALRPVEEQSRLFLQPIFKKLDEQALRKYSTSQKGSGSASKNDTVDDSRYDSIYYILSKENLSLRFKMTNITGGGLARVIEPVADTSIFTKPPSIVSSEPQLGYRVIEYMSTQFVSMQEKGQNVNDYKPNLSLFKLPDGRWLEDSGKMPPGVHHIHEGTLINKIYK